jgi:hypothetical protein
MFIANCFMQQIPDFDKEMTVCTHARDQDMNTTTQAKITKTNKKESRTVRGRGAAAQVVSVSKYFFQIPTPLRMLT